MRPIGFIGRSERFENQRALVNLSQFTLGQGRYLFLRCLVTRPEPEVARVKVSYTDELDNGSEQSTSGAVKIRYTDDEVVADRSVNPGVNAEKVLMLTAEAKDKAIAEADAGNYQQAAQTLAVSARRPQCGLRQCARRGPGSNPGRNEQSARLRHQLVNGKYDGASRKSLQSQSYNTRNSK